MTIPFNKKIYPKKVIERAIKDYSNLVNFKFSQNRRYFLVKVKNLQSNLKKNFQEEFSNYVLSLVKNG